MAFKPKGKLGAKDGKGAKGRSMFKRRKFCRFTVEKIEEVDYKDVKSSRILLLKTHASCRPVLPVPKLAISVSYQPLSSARAFWP